MNIKIAGILLAAVVAAPTAANAQGQSYYTCANNPVRLQIRSMPLGEALAAFTKATRCPVSIDVQEVANTPTREVPTFAVKGRFTPANALKKMLSSSPLKVRTIKGGYSIYMN